jgi:hypothetical protein
MIFVFGSNLAGRHGKGAALTAIREYHAEYGVGKGRTGNAYAIPTKGKNLEVLSLVEIETHIKDFLKYAKNNPEETFMLTPVGTGLAGYSKREIWKIVTKFRPIPTNVLLTSTWFD